MRPFGVRNTNQHADAARKGYGKDAPDYPRRLGARRIFVFLKSVIGHNGGFSHDVL
jgi:hypothetical protein